MKERLILIRSVCPFPLNSLYGMCEAKFSEIFNRDPALQVEFLSGKPTGRAKVGRSSRPLEINDNLEPLHDFSSGIVATVGTAATSDLFAMEISVAACPFTGATTL